MDAASTTRKPICNAFDALPLWIMPILMQVASCKWPATCHDRRSNPSSLPVIRSARAGSAPRCAAWHLPPCVESTAHLLCFLASIGRSYRSRCMRVLAIETGAMTIR